MRNFYIFVACLRTLDIDQYLEMLLEYDQFGYEIPFALVPHIIKSYSRPVKNMIPYNWSQITP